MKSTRTALIAVSLIALLILPTACREHEQPTPGRATEPAYDFVSASPEQLSLIGEVLEDGLMMTMAFSVKSEEHEKAWYVGGQMLGPGMRPESVAVWLISGDASNPGMILAADRLAQEFSGVPFMGDSRTGDPGEESRALRSYLLKGQ